MNNDCTRTGRSNSPGRDRRTGPTSTVRSFRRSLRRSRRRFCRHLRSLPARSRHESTPAGDIRRPDSRSPHRSWDTARHSRVDVFLVLAELTIPASLERTATAQADRAHAVTVPGARLPEGAVSAGAPAVDVNLYSVAYTVRAGGRSTAPLLARAAVAVRIGRAGAASG
jgi:hypothetical protein